MENRSKTRYLVQISLLATIELVLAFTPLGFIPLGVTNITTVHIPVIIGGILLGPMAGAILGGVFGVSSIIINTIRPTLTSFVYSPFYSVGDISGNWKSLIVALLPRILIGVVAAYTFRLLQKRNLNVACIVAGIAGSLTNTVFVLSGIYLLFGQPYAAAREISPGALFEILMGIVAINGVPEAIGAALLTTAIVLPLKRVLKSGEA